MCVCSRAHVCVCARARVRVCVSPGLRRPSPRVATAAVVSLSLSVWYVGVCLCVFVCVRARARVCVLACARVRRARHHGLRRPFPTGPCRPSTGVTTALAASYDGGGRLSLSRSDRTASSTDAAVVVCRRMEVGARVALRMRGACLPRGAARACGGHACVHRPVRVSRQPRGARLTPVRPEFRTRQLTNSYQNFRRSKITPEGIRFL